VFLCSMKGTCWSSAGVP